MKGIDAWLFDLGNTLMSIPQEYDEEECIQRVLGFNECDEVRSVIYRICDSFPGQTTEEFLRRFERAVSAQGNSTISTQLRAAWADSVAAATLKPDAHAILDELRAAGIKLGLVSNTPPTSHDILDRLALRDRFDVIVFSCDAGFLKPDPRIFKLALAKLGVAAPRCVLVGDKIRTDILGGAILGMRCILVEERLRSAVQNGQSYVEAIVPGVKDLRATACFRETVYG